MKGQAKPPFLAEKLLKWVAGRAEMEDIHGDLDEVYQDCFAQNGSFRANTFYWLQIFSLIFSYGLRKRKSKAAYSYYYSKNSIAMFNNYFKIALRNFFKHKLFTSLNIAGLALGMTICLLSLSIAVAIYKSDEFNENKDRIYQINTSFHEEANSKTFASTFHATGHHLQETYPFIEEVVKIQSGFNPEINHSGNLMNFRGYFADASFFDVFDFEMLEGDAATALDDPFSIVLTQSVAQTLFKNENSMGRVLETEKGDFTVTGVVKDPKQTHLFFELVGSYNTLVQLNSESHFRDDWISFRNNYVYVLTKEGADDNLLEVALSNTSQKATGYHTNKTVTLEYVALSNVVPRWNISNALGIGWDQPSLLFFLFIGLLVLLPAVFNYTNLSIARALKRAKEIGVRKVVGAEKVQIKAQFIIETVLLTFLALAGSIALFLPMKEEFLDLVYMSSVLDTSMGFSQILVFILFAVFIGVFAGFFPARFFSRLSPINTLKGDLTNGKANVSGFKKGLFVFQFFVSLVFIIGVATIAKQYSYVLNSSHGFESENVLVVPFNGVEKQLVLNEFGNHPDVQKITASSHIPGIVVASMTEATSNDVDSIMVNQVFVGPDFIQNMDMKLEWGSDQNLEYSNKSEELVLVNKQFLRSMAVFNKQKDSLSFSLDDGTRCRIAGILEDINYEPMTEIIDPLIFRHSLEKSNYALLSVSSVNIRKTINELDEIWSGINQQTRFESSFLDDEIEDAYYFLAVQIKFFTYLSILAITISCLGLLGMVSYSTENRTKEIAVRKIMGASDRSLYYLLTRDFVKLILVSAIIAIPFSYIFYDKLFLHFLIRYGLGLGPGEVIISIVFLFLVGFASIYWQTSKVARANPAGNLRYE